MLVVYAINGRISRGDSCSEYSGWHTSGTDLWVRPLKNRRELPDFLDRMPVSTRMEFPPLGFESQPTRPFRGLNPRYPD